MYNRCLEYLLDYDADNAVSRRGVRVRRAFYPLVRAVLPLTTPTKLKVVRKANIPGGPVIFASTHGFKEDIVDAVVMSGRQAYILIGSLSQIFKTVEGFAAWAAGTVLVDRTDKLSRAASKEKMIKVLEYGGSVLIFPEGTWNKSPNALTVGLFPGVYDIAVETGVPVVPLATHREGKYVYGIMDDPFDITRFGREEGLTVLRDKLSSMRYELWESHSRCCRDTLPFGEQAERYWKGHIDDLMAEVEFYDYDVELHTRFVDRRITENRDAFAHLERLIPGADNAFLFGKSIHG